MFLKKTLFLCLMGVSTVFSQTKIYTKLSLGGVTMGKTFEAQVLSNQAGAFFKNNNPYSAQGFLGTFGFGVAKHQGVIYLDAQIYYLFNSVNQNIYTFNSSLNAQDSVSLRAGSGVGIIGQIGWNNSFGAIPFISIGFEYAERSLTYAATNLTPNYVIKKTVPSCVFGIGIKGEISRSVTLSLEAQYKHSKTIDIAQVPASGGYPSLSGSRLRVDTNQWAILIGMAYKLRGF